MVVGVTTARQDVLDFLDHAWGRLRERMTGLTDDEWSWCPIDADNKVSIRWRLDHLTNMFTEPRNWAWLGCTPSDRPSRAGAESASDATQLLSAAYADLRVLLGNDQDWGAQIGSAAGQFGEATRRSFLLHIADELIHHSAEAALLRDLYAGRAPR
jgi:hypothetical protein